MKLPKLRKRIAEVAEAIRRAEERKDDKMVDALFSYLLARPKRGPKNASRATKKP